MTTKTPLELAAFHEAAHAVAILVSPLGRSLATIRVNADGSGIVRGTAFTPLVFLVGPAGAQRAGAAPLAESSNDVGRAVELLVRGRLISDPGTPAVDMFRLVFGDLTRVWTTAELFCGDYWSEIERGAAAILATPDLAMTADEFARAVGISNL